MEDMLLDAANMGKNQFLLEGLTREGKRWECI